jgi:WhiB family redox-sensing transcriptional regulator
MSTLYRRVCDCGTTSSGHQTPHEADHALDGHECGDSWRDRAACRDEDPELFFPIGTSEPALLQTEHAKAVCRRCPVVNDCLQWAVQSGKDTGVWGGLDEQERQALKRTGL